MTKFIIFLLLFVWGFNCEGNKKNNEINSENDSITRNNNIDTLTEEKEKVIQKAVNNELDNEVSNELILKDKRFGALLFPEIHLSDEFANKNDSSEFNLSQCSDTLNFEVGDFAAYWGTLIGSCIKKRGNEESTENTLIEIYQKMYINIFENEDGSGGVTLSETFTDTIFSEWHLLNKQEDNCYRILDSIEMKVPTISDDIKYEIEELKKQREKEGKWYRNYFPAISVIIFKIKYDENIKYLIFKMQYGD